MTPQEQKMLDDLMARVDNTRLDDKDPEAAQRIEEWSRRNRDAAYILAQTVLVQSYALEQAKAQIQSLQQQLAQHPALAQRRRSKAASWEISSDIKTNRVRSSLRPDMRSRNSRATRRYRNTRHSNRMGSRPDIHRRAMARRQAAGRAFCALPRRRPQAWRQVRWRLRALSR